jgi:pimeloyl-ACP methyl ester carboxylesterase
MRRRAIVAALAAQAALACSAEPIPQSRAFPAGTPFRAFDRVIDGTRLRMIDTGRGPAVVFIHGLGASMYSWRHQLEPVLAAGFRVVAYDNRGFGFSERPDSGYSNEAYARLLVAVLDSLGIHDAVLVGHSMGGAIAGEVAVRYPERVLGLVLLGPAGYLSRSSRLLRLPTAGRVAMALASRSSVAGVLRLCYADPRRVTEEDIDQYYAPVKLPGTQRAMSRVLANFAFDGLRGRLAPVTAPTLVLWGAEDRVIPLSAAARLAEEPQRAAFFVVPDAGHNLQEEQPREITQSLIGFLQHGLPATPPDLAAGRSSATRRSTPSRIRDD